jgi:hypothetical protein
MGIAETDVRRLAMKKTIPRALLVTFPFFIKATRSKSYALVVMVCMTGCTATVVRWNSVRMREEIMAYYNDEIMDNLIRMKDGLPFVHVDISSVSAQGISQLSGTVGSGDTESFTRTSPSSNMMGALRTITRAASTPFTYSVTPLHNDTLTMTAVPVIGPLSGDGQGVTSGPPEAITKVTEVRKPPLTTEEPEGKLESKTIEKAPKPAPIITIYTIYERYRKSLAENPNALVYGEGLIRPNQKEVVPGTLRRVGARYYYIRNDPEGKNKAEYNSLCMSLFTQSRGKTSGKTLKAEVENLKAQGALIPSTPR